MAQIPSTGLGRRELLRLAGDALLFIALPGLAEDRSNQENNAASRNPFSLNTILLGGLSKSKILAARQVGFDQIELWTHDVDGFHGGANTIGAGSRRRPRSERGV